MLVPSQIATREPNPALIGQASSSAIMISGPSEIFVGNPRPSVIGVGPVTISIRTPIRIIHRYVRLPAVAVVSGFDPVPAGQIIVKEIDRDLLSPRLGERRQDKSEQR